MRGIDAVFSAARLLARTTGLSISAAVTALSLKAEVVVGFFVRQFFVADEASLTDTQTVDVTKTLTEAPSVVDSDVITLLKRLTDSGAITDDDVLTIVKGLTETPAVAEAHIFALTKPLTDSSSVADLASIRPVKALTEAPSVADNDTLDITKIAGDDTNHDYCDLTYFAEDYIQGDRTDRAYVAESNVVSITKFLDDQTFVTDDLDGEASAEDDQEIAFVKTRTDIGVVSETFDRTVVYLRDFTENGGATESAVKLTTKFRSDSGAVSDSGDLRSQGYCDFTYFAEDYVGASRAF
jgi:phosphohistidine swiveling domain-containing protein